MPVSIGQFTDCLNFFRKLVNRLNIPIFFDKLIDGETDNFLNCQTIFRRIFFRAPLEYRPWSPHALGLGTLVGTG